jgi:hypothetical protein
VAPVRDPISRLCCSSERRLLEDEPYPCKAKYLPSAALFCPAGFSTQNSPARAPSHAHCDLLSIAPSHRATGGGGKQAQDRRPRWRQVLPVQCPLQERCCCHCLRRVAEGSGSWCVCSVPYWSGRSCVHRHDHVNLQEQRNPLPLTCRSSGSCCLMKRQNLSCCCGLCLTEVAEASAACALREMRECCCQCSILAGGADAADCALLEQRKLLPLLLSCLPLQVAPLARRPFVSCAVCIQSPRLSPACPSNPRGK